MEDVSWPSAVIYGSIAFAVLYFGLMRACYIFVYKTLLLIWLLKLSL